MIWKTTISFLSLLLVICFGSDRLLAQSSDFTTSCTSNDLSVVGAELTNLQPCFTCTGDTQLNPTLAVSIDNKTKSTRTSFAFWGTLNAYDVDGNLVSSEEISGCEGPVPGNGITTINFDRINYTCGTTLEITNLLIAWTSASPNEVCPLDRNDIKPKCGTAQSIEVVPPLFTVINNQTNETCENSSDGSIDISTEGGSGSYTYNWSDLPGSNNVEDRENLAPGTYSVSVTDSDGCTTNLNGIVVEAGQNPNAPVVDSVSQPTCQTATGSFTVSTVNGLQYSIGGDYQTSGSFTGLDAGTYQVTAKNADGCTSTATSVTIDPQPNTPNAPVVSSTVQPTCETATGSFTVSAVNGLQYSIGGDYQTSGSFTGLDAGTYQVTAKNADGCVSTATSVTIDQQPNTPDAPVVSSTVQPTCETATGSFTVSTVNGLQYSIGGDYQTSGFFTGLDAGTYQVTAKNADGCISTATSVTINQQPDTPDAPVVSSTVQPTCETATGSFTVSTVNGLQYSIGGDYQTSGSFTGLSAGTYQVTAKNADGCISTATSVTIDPQPNTPDAPVVSSTVQPTCETATGSFTVSTVNGLQYSIGGDYQTSGSFTGLSAGTYQVTAKNADGCISPATSVVIQEQPNTPDAPVVSTTVQPTCETETGSITVTTVNGLQYSIGGDYQSSGSFTGLAAGTYNVTAKNADGCISPATSVVIQEQPNTPDAPVVSTTVQPTCETATGSISVTTAQGFTYSINGTDYQTSGSFTGLDAGTYQVTAQNADGCISTATSATINPQPNTPDAPVVSATVQPTCQTTIGSFTVSAVNGLQYSIGGDYQTSGSFTGLDAGTYQVTAKNADGCISTATSVTINPQPNTPDAPVVSATVQPTCQTATGSFTVSAVNGLQYSIGGDYQTSGSFTGLSAGTYQVTAKNDDGCISSATSVTINPQPDTPDAPVVSSIVQPTCETATGSFTVSTVNGLQYSIGGDYQTSGSFTGLDAGTYQVTAKNADGCISTVTSVTIDPQPDTPDAPVVSTTVQPTCETATGSFTVSTVNGLQYSIGGDYQTSGSFTGLDAGTYQVTAKNGDGCISTATSVTINEQPIGATANNDAASTNEDNIVTINVLDNDTNPGDGNLTIVDFTQPGNGSVTKNDDDTFEYTPNENYNGEDTFSYTITNGECGNLTATVTITINPVNDAPVAVDDSASTSEDTPVQIDVLNNDSDPDGDTLTVTEVTQPGNGSAVINTDGTVTYTPNENFNGTDTFTYTISDGNGGTDTATVTVTIGAENDAPVAVDDSASTSEDTPVQIDVLNNDSDPDGDALAITEVTQPGNGTVVINTDGTVTYTPNENFNGTDTFTYTISDGNGGTDTATVTVTIAAENDAPVAVDDSASTSEDTPVQIDVLNNDSDPDGDALTVTEVTQPGNGTVVINTDGTVTYTPNENFNGTDTFTYTISDGNGGTDTATVTVTIAAENDAPVAVDDSASTSEDTPVQIDVLNNDSDPDGDALTVTEVTQPGNGTAVINTDGTVTYTPNENFNGTDTFTYTISDGNGGTDTATVTVTIGAENDAPIAVDDSASTSEDTPVQIDVLNNDSDPDGDALTVTEVTQPGNGTAVINTDGTVTYTPDENFNGTDTFTYTISDGNGGTDTATVTVTIAAENDDPVANNDTATTDQEVPVTITVLDNDTDIDGDELTVINTTNPENGSVVINQDGTVTYSPNESFTGEDTFTYTISDNNGGTDTATVIVFVNDTEGPEIACPDTLNQENDPGICGAVVEFSLPEIVDNSGNATIEQTAGPASGEVFPVGTTTVSFTATDAAGNTSFCSFDVIVTDSEAPVVEEMNDITVNNDAGVCGAVVDFGMIGATDNCELESVEVTEGLTSGSEFPVGTTTVTYTVTDASGNTTTESFTVTVVDNEAPAISCPANMTVGTATGESFAIVNFTDATATDNCSVTVEQTAGPVSGSEFEIGTTTVTFTATDAAGNTSECSFTVTVEDNEDPIITCPETISQENDPGVCGAVVEFSLPEIVDNSGNATIEQTAGPASGEVFPVGTTTISFTATDAAGNTSFCSFDVIVTDSEAPVVEEMNDITVNNDAGVCGAVVDFGMIGATDNCELESVEVTEGLTSGSEFPVGTTTVTYTVTDASGNTTTESFTVTVVDNEAPAISCPENMTVGTATGESFAIVNFTDATGTDNCSVTVEQTAGPVSGSQFEIGTTTVTFTATDAAGNTSECSFTVTVEDNEDPTIVCQDDIELSNNEDICGAVVEFNTPQGADNSGDFTVTQTAGPASGEVFPVGTTTVTFTVTDAAGNTSECSFDITVTDDQAPELETLENITVNNDAGICGAVVTYEAPTATDNCELSEVTLTEGMESGSEFPVGTTMVTYTATDINGNTSTTTFTVTVIDNEAPVIECPENISVTVGFGIESSIVEYSVAQTTDNCSGETITMTSGIASGEEFPLGVTTITFEATDAAGNTSECSFTVTVEEEPAPAPPAAPVVDVVQPSCSEPTGTITVDVQNGLTYSIDGETYQAIGIFTNLSPGTYDVVAQDEFGQLSDLTTIVLTEPVAEDIVLIDNGVVDLCIDDSAFNLFDLIANNEDVGTWIDTDNTGALDNGFITPGSLELGTYTFELQIDGNCPQSTFVTVMINDDCVVLDCSVEDVRNSISKAVTPNGDNINDFFTIDTDIACGFTYDLKIFNRWGAKVFDAKNYQNNWDGYSDSSFTNSNQLPSGTYFYVLEIREGNFEPIQGYIYLGTK